MADVLIVCVREDEPQAKALAEMFEAAGFSIGGAPSSDSGLRSSGAGLVVWSQASIRSRPFLDAAQRVINAEKAVVASLIEPPPPSSVGSSPVFDLSHWDGDPNDPALDPLFFAVDRMVNSVRAGADVGPAPPAARDYDEPRAPPPAPRAPPPRRAPEPPTYTPRSSAPVGDELGSEAEHWRAIRDSRNPSDFMDYLARFGSDGAFAEVAELRLKQLTARGDGRPMTPPRAAAPAPQRSPPPPQRVAPPPRAPAPRPAPRAEAPPPRREPPPARRPDPLPPQRPMFERGFDRAELREPPRAESGGGGALRAFILIALLGGVALAGGLYFGGGIPDFAAAPTQTQPGATDVASTEPADASALDEPVGVPLEDTTTRPVQTAARREPTPAETRAEPEAPPPAPVTSWSGPQPASGGPVSLTPNELAANSQGSVIPLSPPPASSASNTTTIAATPPRTAPAATVRWAQRPSARRIAELYPQRALREGVGGRVELNCNVQASQALSCSVANESPAGLGFGRAALSASSSYRADPTRSDGSSAVGANARIVVQFQAPPQQQ